MPRSFWAVTTIATSNQVQRTFAEQKERGLWGREGLRDEINESALFSVNQPRFRSRLHARHTSPGLAPKRSSRWLASTRVPDGRDNSTLV